MCRYEISIQATAWQVLGRMWGTRESQRRATPAAHVPRLVSSDQSPHSRDPLPRFQSNRFKDPSESLV